jgi:hypothetical protein
MRMQDLFDKFLTGTENDKAEVREFLIRHENMHMLYSREFTNLAIQNATLLGVNPDAAQAKIREEWVEAVMAGDTDESFEDWRFPWEPRGEE